MTLSDSYSLFIDLCYTWPNHFSHDCIKISSLLITKYLLSRSFMWSSSKYFLQLLPFLQFSISMNRRKKHAIIVNVYSYLLLVAFVLWFCCCFHVTMGLLHQPMVGRYFYNLLCLIREQQISMYSPRATRKHRVYHFAIRFCNFIKTKLFLEFSTRVHKKRDVENVDHQFLVLSTIKFGNKYI